VLRDHRTWKIFGETKFDVGKDQRRIFSESIVKKKKFWRN